MTLALGGDLVVAVLLVATIVYAARLNRRLAALRSDRAQLEALIESLGGATANAGAGIAGLKVAAETVGREIEARLARAQSLRDDLAYMIERGNAAADRLEVSIRARREPPPAAEAAVAPAPVVGAAPSRAERDLMRALAARRSS